MTVAGAGSGRRSAAPAQTDRSRRCRRTMAPSSAARPTQASPRPRSSRNRRVSASEGKTVVVAPSSAPMLANHVPVHRRQRLDAGAVVLDNPPRAPRRPPWRRSIPQDHVLGADPVGAGGRSGGCPRSAACAGVKGRPAIAIATSSPPAPMPAMPSEPAAQVWRVRAEQRLSRHAEALHVDRMADAVAGAAVPDAEPLARALPGTGGRRDSCDRPEARLWSTYWTRDPRLTPGRGASPPARA